MTSKHVAIADIGEQTDWVGKLLATNGDIVYIISNYLFFGLQGI